MPSQVPLLNRDGRRTLLVPFILLTSLFFLWGFAHGLLDVLNKHFQELLQVSRAESGLVQFSVYGGYFLAAMPAGWFMHRFGYKKGILLGLLLYAAGAFLFYPAASMQTFLPFLIALMIIAFGLAFLETAANPYVAVLGPPESAERRLNLSQSFNGLGWIFGPMAGGLIIFGMQSKGAHSFSSIAWPYIGVGFVVVGVAIFFQRTTFPPVAEEQEQGPAQSGYRDLFRHRHFILAVAAQFFYVAAQTGVNSFFINYTTETMPGISNAQAALILSLGGMGLFWAGRLSGSFLMRSIQPHRLLSVYAALCMLLMLIVIGEFGWFSVTALFITYFFMSVMFPTIFVLGLKGLGPLTRRASSFLVMAIVGGALCPVVMGYIADQSAMRWGFAVPLACFAFVLFFGLRGYRIRD